MRSPHSLLAPLASERLVLEPMRGFHAPLLFTGLSEPRLYHWVSSLPPPSVQHLQRRWDSAPNGVPTQRGETLLNWAVRRLEDKAYVGKCDAVVDASNIASNVGYLIFLPFWQQGYATEVVRVMVAHLEQHDVVEQHAFVTVGNVASERVLLKSGFSRTRILPENDTIRGEKHDDVEYVRCVTSLPAQLRSPDPTTPRSSGSGGGS